MKARIPKHREFIINFPDSIDQNKANEGWDLRDKGNVKAVTRNGST